MGDEGGGVILGRQGELSAIEAFLDQASRGTAVLVLQGEAGIGKTTLWQAGVRGAEAQGRSLLVARAVRTEAGLPYVALADLLASVDDDLVGLLPAPQSQALETALLRRAAPEGELDPRAVAVAFLGILRLVARRGPCLVAIDDLEWVDEASRGALEFALRRLGEEPIGFLCTLRSTTEEAGPLALGGRRQPALWLRRLHLGPLDREAIQALCTAVAGRELSRWTLGRIHEASRGNPFHALELVRALVQAGITELVPGQPFPVPPDLESLVRARLGRLPRSTRRILLAAACLSDPRVDQLDAALGPPGRAAHALEVGERAGIVERRGDGVRFVHPLYAWALYQSAHPAERRELHRRLARVASNPEDAARHLALAAEGPDEEIAAALEGAARQAAQRGAPQAAAELLELACTLTPAAAGEAARRRALGAARAHAAANHGDRAWALLEQLIEGDLSPAWRGEVLRLQGELAILRHGFPRGIELFRTALAELGLGPRLRALLGLDLTYALASSTLDVEQAREHARAALYEAQRSGDRVLVAQAVSTLTVVDQLAGEGFDAEASAEAMVFDEPEWPRPESVLAVRPRYNHGFLLTMSGQLGEARRVLEEVVHQSSLRGEVAELAFPYLFLVYIGCATGELEEAARVSLRSLRDAELSPEPWSLGLSHFARALLLAHSGPLEEARNTLAVAHQVLDQMGWTAGLWWTRWLRGFIHLAAGEGQAAARTFRTFLDTLIPGSSLAAVPDAVPDAVEALLGMGALEAARQAEELLPERSARGSPWVSAARARSRGLIEAQAGPGAGLRWLEEAAAGFEEAGRRFDLARLLLARGRIERRWRWRRAARLSLERAESLFGAMAAEPWAALARNELARIGGRSPMGRDLTASERRVAELAALGWTNRQIADELALSVRTVESHLAAVFRKLEVERRSQLSVRLAATSLKPPPRRGGTD
jgi:DNA-binding CsgD family transcriptional regulator